MRFGRQKIRSSYVIATALAVTATVWVLSGILGGSSSPANSPSETAAAEEPAKPAPKVRVRRQDAQVHRQQLILRGQTAASRSVQLKAETSSVVDSIGAREGNPVAGGDVIVALARDHRDARLAEAQALVRQRQVEYDAASKLAKKGFTAQTRFAETQAQLDAARAALKAIELDLDDTTVEAPFDGILEKRYVEIGDFLDVGDPIARVLDLDPLYVVVSVSERNIGRLSYGDTANARLVTGDEVSGTVTYIGAASDPETRTFEVEIEVPNPDYRLADGISAEVQITIDEVEAHRVSPAVLTLDDSGAVGIKIVNADNVVEFHPIQIVSDYTNGIWLSGLPGTIDVITVGQEFVKPGQKVEPVQARTAAGQ